MRGAARIDANQPALVKGLRAAGYRVLILSRIGHGVPDLLVGTPDGRLALLEVKNPTQKPSDQRLTPDEARFHAEWSRFPVFEARSVVDALDKLGHSCFRFNVSDAGRACADCGRPLT